LGVLIAEIILAAIGHTFFGVQLSFVTRCITLREVNVIAEYNNKSLVFGVPGLVLQIGGNIAARTSPDPTTAAIGGVALLVGTVLLMMGLAYYAKAKGRPPGVVPHGFSFDHRIDCVGLFEGPYAKRRGREHLGRPRPTVAAL
jgi:hypothetical protein